jgi:hypothetical protein
MGLANASALLALAALAVPVAIHLWSRKSGKRVLLGTLRWLQAEPEARASSVRLTEPLLLLVRCLLLACVVLLLAVPFFEGATDGTGSGTGVVLVPEAVRTSAEKGTQQLLDSLQRAGHVLEILGGDDYWHAVRTRDQSLAAGKPLLVVADAEAGHYHGKRPVLSRRVQWHTVPTAQTRRHWETVYSMGDSVYCLVATSAPQGQTLERIAASTKPGSQQIAIAGVGNFAVRQSTSGEMVFANVQTGERHRINKLFSQTVVVAYAEGRMEEARYTSAAVQAASAAMGATVTVRPVPIKAGKTADLGESDVVVWLADEAVPEALLSARQLVLCAAGNGQALAAPVSVTTPDGTFVLRARASLMQGAAVWKDAAGNAVLTVERKNDAVVYRFAAKLTPSQTSLVETEQLAQLMLRLLLDGDRVQQTETGANDARLLDARQVLPQTGNQAHVSDGHRAGLNAWQWWLWAAAVLLFCTDAWLSYKRA